MKIAGVGLGYVELPLAIQFARTNVAVLGLDVDTARVDLINSGQNYIKHILQETIERYRRENAYARPLTSAGSKK